MSKKDDILRHAEEMRRREIELRKLEDWEKRPPNYKQGMPVGCWLWIAAALAAAYYALTRLPY